MQAAPARLAREAQRPQLMHGLQIGDVRADRALIWARSDRAAQLCVEWCDNAAGESFARDRRVHRG